MTLTVIDPTGSFTCKKCKLTFEATYKPQQRPRKSCPKCHKMVGMTVKKSSKTSSTKKRILPQEGGTSHTPLTTRLTSDDLEKRLISALEQQPNNPNLLRTAIDFFIKVRIKSDAMEDEIDMEVLKSIGLVAESGD